MKNIVVVGAGIQGTSVAFYLAERLRQSNSPTSSCQITLLEAVCPASAASGKGGGFMARSWGDGSPTQALHEVSFDMYESLAKELGFETYRKLPVLSVLPGYHKPGQPPADLAEIFPSWLDGSFGRVKALGSGDDTAQVTPSEVVEKMLSKYADRIQVIQGTCLGLETDAGDSPSDDRRVTAVNYAPSAQLNQGVAIPNLDISQLAADVVVVSAGPWSCSAEDWFDNSVKFPMEGIKSASIVWKKPDSLPQVDATALFCGEHSMYGTHLEVYPRPNGEVYICGIGGSEYVKHSDLKEGIYRSDCEPSLARVEVGKAAFLEMSSLYQNVGKMEKSQACMRPCPPDALPYMGPIPGYDGAFINAGHNCWGIAWAPACGKAMAELILDGESQCVDLAPFSPARFTPGAKRGGRGRKKQSSALGEQW